MNLTSLLIPLSLTAIGILCCSAIATKKKLLRYSTVILLSLAIFSYSSTTPALAAADSINPGAVKSYASPEKQELQESLNLTPDGGHYSGIEYAQRTAEAEKPLSDSTIKATLEEYSNDNLTVAVTNGAVRLSGRVKDKNVARHIIEQTKTIPGVHEVTFNLGLDNKAL